MSRRGPGRVRTPPTSAHLPGRQLKRVLLERLHLVQPGRDDLLQLFEGVRLEGHPGQTLQSHDQTGVTVSAAAPFKTEIQAQV